MTARGRVVVVTGTSTGVGKTIATAALAARALDAGEQVVVVKLVQTGASESDPGDAEVIHRLTSCAVQEHAALDEPLAPDSAARRAGVTLPPMSEHADRIRVLTESHDLVLVEGSGGLLVRLDTEGGTLLDVLAYLGWADVPFEVVVVVGPGLGTLNHTELTVEALRKRAVEPSGLIVGSWPAEPGLAERSNLVDLPRVTGLPILAIIPAGAGVLVPARFRSGAHAWFSG